MARAQQDSDSTVSVSVALPNAANTAATNFIDLGAVTPFPVQEHFAVKISTSIATGANSKNINVALQHCDDTNVSNAVNIPEIVCPYVTAGNGTKHIAASISVMLPPNVKRYIRATALGEATGGDSSDGTLTVQLLF